ncbi:hypothetical protein [Planctomicrobium sp. SH664]|uniref:hypothetical protein n=1 Tax=Planctomicrobium sp. SH664 TaxID=3448125 RepID=UPI003F5B8321
MPEARFERITAPGLPAWPWLMFNEEHQRAIVSFRLATWRSGQQADRLSQQAAVGIALLIGWNIWNRVAFFDNLIGQAIVTLIGFGCIHRVLSGWIPLAFSSFLARKVFARRSTVWFTPNEIAFRSRLYERGIVIPRTWNGHPVQIRFDVSSDPDAQEELARSHRHQNHDARHRLQSAHMLRLLISATDPQRSLGQSVQSPLARAIPMFQVDLHDAQRLTVVLAAAAQLTARIPLPTAQSVPGPDDGLDIDANPT